MLERWQLSPQGWRRIAAEILDVATLLVSIGIVAMLLIGLLGFVVAVSGELSQTSAEDLAGLSIGQRLEHWLAASLAEVMETILLWFLPFMYVSIFIVPFLLVLPVAAPIIGLWSAPGRILVLRPFNRGALSLPLKEVVRRHFAPMGHVYTLADSDIYMPWYVRIPILLGQLAVLSFRFRQVRGEADVLRLERALKRTWLRNINWCLSRTKVFAVAANDACWRMTVESLVRRMDVIVIDATELRQHLLWEVEMCCSAGCAERLLFISEDQQEECTSNRLRDVVPRLASPVVFRYRGGALARKHDFERCVTARIAARRAPQLSPADGVLFWLPVATVLLFSLQYFPVLGLLADGFGIFATWTPPSSGGAWPGLAAVANPGALTIAAVGMITFVLLILNARTKPTMFVLAVVQAVALIAAPFGMLA